MSKGTEWATYKKTWRGEYRRLLQVTSDSVTTLDPKTRRITNDFAMSDVLSVEVQQGRELVLGVAGGAGCSALCGLIRRELRFALPSPALAAAARAAVRGGVTRYLSTADTQRARCGG